jgi:signal transduction histidine kinase
LVAWALVVGALGVLWLLDARGVVPHGRVAFYGIGEGLHRNGPYAWLRYGAVVVLAFFITMAASVARKMYLDAGVALAAAREEVLRGHEDRIRSLETLGATIAHEVRNPLSTIVGLAQLLRRTADAGSAGHLDVLSREADRLNAVLDEYLAFAKPVQATQLEPVDVAKLLDGLLAAFSPRLAEGRVRVAREVAAGVSPVRGDARRLTQAFFNLIQNALEALENEPGDLRLAVRPLDGGVEASVSDSGPGVAPAVAQKLFTPFVTTKPKGTGLGLLVARSAVSACGGTLTLLPAPEGGARASVWLPRWEG